METHQQEVLYRLNELGIPYEYHAHQLVHTIEECLALPYAAPDVTFCKNILLCNRQQTQFYLLVTPPEKPFRTAVVSKQLGVSRLSFAPGDALPQLVGTQSGSLSPFSIWFDQAHLVQLVMDQEIFRPGRIAFHPCDATATLIFSQQVFREQALPALSPYLIL